MRTTTADGIDGLLFGDQLKYVCTWFDDWNDCERTVVLYSLLQRLPPAQARFLAHCIHGFHSDSYELPLLENRANSSEYLESLHELNPDTATRILVQLLPLLRSGDDEIRAQYLTRVREVLSHALRTRTLYDECRQLLTYSLMHPAFNAGDRNDLKLWTRRFDDFAINGGIGSSFSFIGASVNGATVMSNGHDRQHQSNSVNKVAAVTSTYAPTVSSSRHRQPATGQQQFVSRLDSWTNGTGSVGEVTAPHSPPNLVSANSTNAAVSDVFNGIGGGGGGGGTVRSASIGCCSDLHGSVSGAGDSNCVNQLAVRINNTVSFFTPPPPLKMVNSEGGPAYCALSQGDAFLNGGRARRSNSLTPPSSSSSSSSLSSMLGCNGVGGGGVCNGGGGGGALGGLCQLGPETLGRLKPRSMSLSSTSGLLSPQSSLTSSGSGSEGHLEGSFSFDNVGMKGIPAWLKGLRLHKYTHLFSGLTYDEMFEMTDETLTAREITRGARNKIILNIQKLRDRQETVNSLAKNLQEGGTIRTALSGLGSIVETPLVAFKPDRTVDRNSSDNNTSSVGSSVASGDLPVLITRLFGKILLELLHSQPEDDNMHQFLDLTDKCLNHEAFTDSQKRRMTVWYQQVREECRSLAPRRGSDYRHNRGRLNRNYVGGGYGGNGIGVTDFGLFGKYGSSIGVTSSSSSNHHHYALERRRISGPNVLPSAPHLTLSGPATDFGNFRQIEQQQQQQSSSAHHQQQRVSSPAILVNATDLSCSPIPADHALYRNGHLSIPNLLNKRGSLQETNSHSLLMRTKSAPDNHNQYQLFGNGKPATGLNSTETDFINLESVSRSVTEHALGDSG